MFQSLVEPPDCRLVYYGKREVLARIDNMEDEYDQPMTYIDPGPTVPSAAPTGDPSQPWGDEIVVVGTAHPRKADRPQV